MSGEHLLRLLHPHPGHCGPGLGHRRRAAELPVKYWKVARLLPASCGLSSGGAALGTVLRSLTTRNPIAAPSERSSPAAHQPNRTRRTTATYALWLTTSPVT